MSAWRLSLIFLVYSLATYATTEQWLKDLRSQIPAVRSAAAKSLAAEGKVNPQIINELVIAARRYENAKDSKEQGAAAAESYQTLVKLAPNDSATFDLYLELVSHQPTPPAPLEMLAFDSSAVLNPSDKPHVASYLSGKNRLAAIESGRILAADSSYDSQVLEMVNRLLPEMKNLDAYESLHFFDLLQALGPRAHSIAPAIEKQIRLLIRRFDRTPQPSLEEVGASDFMRGAKRRERLEILYDAAKSLAVIRPGVAETRSTLESVERFFRINETDDHYARESRRLLDSFDGKPPPSAEVIYLERFNHTLIHAGTRPEYTFESEVNQLEDLPAELVGSRMVAINELFDGDLHQRFFSAINQYGSPRLKLILSGIDWCAEALKNASP